MKWLWRHAFELRMNRESRCDLNWASSKTSIGHCCARRKEHWGGHRCGCGEPYHRSDWMYR